MSHLGLARQTLQQRQSRTNAALDFAATEAFELEAAAKLHHERVQFQDMHLAIRRQSLGERECSDTAETADLECAVGSICLGQPLQNGAPVRTRRPLRLHVDLRKALLVVPLPVLLQDSRAQLRQRRSHRWCRPGSRQVLRRRVSGHWRHWSKQVGVREGRRGHGTTCKAPCRLPLCGRSGGRSGDDGCSRGHRSSNCLFGR
mmetsp:Transcript_3178/g.8166  ORF Transcript_3178/g.8166 Transcript_3178/m.8166 type:complete len:202 (-) Transcript_3178:92-697(-)